MEDESIALPVLGQDNYLVNKFNSTGVQAFRSYSGLKENINLYNDNLNIIIPLFTLRGRNGHDLPVVFRHNSKIQEWVFHPDEFFPGYWTYDSIAGLSGADGSFNVELLPNWTYFGPGGCSTGEYVPNMYVFTEVDGTRHELFNRQFGEAVLCEVKIENEVMHSVDSSHMRLHEDSSSQWILFKNGNIAGPTGFNAVFFDTNGNGISSYSNGSTQTVIDTLGRIVEKLSLPDGYEIRVRDADGSQRTYKFIHNSTQSELIFPDATGAATGLRYRFEWAPFGPIHDPSGLPYTPQPYEYELVKITHPTNGYTRYNWQMRTVQVEKGVTTLKGKYINADDEQGEAFWEYNTEMAFGGAQVKGPDLSYTHHYFNGLGYEDRTDFWSAAGTLSKKLVRTWSGGGTNHRIQTETTIIEPNGANLQSKVEYDYDTNGYTGDTNGNITEIREFGFNTGAPGSLVRKTTSSYLDVNPLYGVNGNHILDRKTQEIVRDSAGNQKARTDYVYDDYTTPRTLVDTPNVAQHDINRGTSFTVRGNLSMISRWLDTTGSFLNTNFRYDIAGNIREETDP